MKVSICIATYNKAPLLRNTLESIFAQEGDYEVIVVDDGSATEETTKVCANYPIRYTYVSRASGYRNPSIARNIAYKQAVGDIVIAQSDDVVHATCDCINTLCATLRKGTFVIANVINVDASGKELANILYNNVKRMSCYTGPSVKRPLFFLGALYREDLYAVGGNDEEFIYPGREDVWFANCLMQGLKLEPIYTADVIGYHQNHMRAVPRNQIRKSHSLYRQKYKLALQGLHPWTAKSGPWQSS